MKIKFRVTLFLVCFLVFISGCVVVSKLNKFIGSTNSSLFSNKNETINDTLWKIDRFQVVYLLTYRWLKHDYILGVYKDNNGWIQFIRLLVECDGKSCDLTFTPLMTENKVIQPHKIEEYGKYFVFGQKFEAVFIYSGERLDDKSYPICKENLQACQVASLSNRKIKYIENFKSKQRLNVWTSFLPVLFINLDTVNKT